MYLNFLNKYFITFIVSIRTIFYFFYVINYFNGSYLLFYIDLESSERISEQGKITLLI
jgi:hypothetical protein